DIARVALASGITTGSLVALVVNGILPGGEVEEVDDEEDVDTEPAGVRFDYIQHALNFLPLHLGHGPLRPGLSLPSWALPLCDTQRPPSYKKSDASSRYPQPFAVR